MWRVCAAAGGEHRCSGRGLLKARRLSRRQSAWCTERGTTPTSSELLPRAEHTLLATIKGLRRRGGRRRPRGFARPAGREVAADADQPQHDRVDHPPFHATKAQACQRAHSSRKMPATVNPSEIAP